MVNICERLRVPGEDVRLHDFKTDGKGYFHGRCTSSMVLQDFQLCRVRILLELRVVRSKC